MTQTFAKELIIPEALKTEGEAGAYAKFIAEPYERGYGHTIGNSLRRILLSSLEGAAAVAVRIRGARHEYSTITGVHEDVINILLNLKKLRVRLTSETPETVLITVSGKRQVKASDIKTSANVEIINKDLVICNLEAGTSFEAELEIARGSGYLTAEEVREKMNLPADFIPMDALFSPVQKVNYNVRTPAWASAPTTTSSCSRSGPTAPSPRPRPSTRPPPCCAARSPRSCPPTRRRPAGPRPSRRKPAPRGSPATRSTRAWR
jgi:hypothetical protein